VKKWVGVIAVLLMMSVACNYAQKQKKAMAPTPSTKKMAVHPKLTEQEKLMACNQCHKEVTPEIYEEWFNSVHGIANVKCFQCHGTFENFHVTPELKKCEACHFKEVSHSPKGRSCWECHPSHKFTVHK